MKFTRVKRKAFELFMYLEEDNTNPDVVYDLDVSLLSISFQKVILRGEEQGYVIRAREWEDGEGDALIAAMEKELSNVG